MVNFFASAFSVFEARTESLDCEEKASHLRGDGWTGAVKKVLTSGSMRRFHERILRSSNTGISTSTSDVWLLGVCYKVSQEESSVEPATNGLVAFEHDFSSRILMTYRKGLYSSICSFYLDS